MSSQNFFLQKTRSEYLNANEWKVSDDTHMSIHVPQTSFSKFPFSCLLTERSFLNCFTSLRKRAEPEEQFHSSLITLRYDRRFVLSIDRKRGNTDVERFHVLRSSRPADVQNKSIWQQIAVFLRTGHAVLLLLSWECWLQWNRCTLVGGVPRSSTFHSIDSDERIHQNVLQEGGPVDIPRVSVLPTAIHSKFVIPIWGSR